MKRILSLMMSLIIIFSLVACSSGNTHSKGSNNIEQNNSNNSSNNNGEKINREDLSLKVSKDEKKTITISVMGKAPIFELAAKEYEKIHPNITIELKSFAKGGGGMSHLELEKYVAQTTTEVLSGKGADLFILNDQNLPIDRYIDKNAFVDLNQYIERDTSFDKSQYYMNILDHSKVNGGLYVLPTRFFIGALFANQEALSKTGVKIDDSQNWTWSRFAEMSEQLKTKGTLESVMEVSPSGILNPLVFSDEYIDQLVDTKKKEAKFDSPLFIDLLKEVKKMYDDHVVSDYQPGVQTETYFTSSAIYSPKDYVSRSANYYQNTAIYEFPHASEKSGVTFDGYDRYAMNANSTVKMEAWDYLKFVMSYDMQKPDQTDTFSMFPINKAANEKAFTDLINGSKVENQKNNGGKGGNVKVTEASLEPLKQMISEANTLIQWNEKIRTIIEEESNSYFSGQKSAQSVADIIQNRVMTYLNE